MHGAGFTVGVDQDGWQVSCKLAGGLFSRGRRWSWQLCNLIAQAGPLPERQYTTVRDHDNSSLVSQAGTPCNNHHKCRCISSEMCSTPMLPCPLRSSGLELSIVHIRCCMLFSSSTC